MFYTTNDWNLKQDATCRPPPVPHTCTSSMADTTGQTEATKSSMHQSTWSLRTTYIHTHTHTHTHTKYSPYLLVCICFLLCHCKKKAGYGDSERRAMGSLRRETVADKWCSQYIATQLLHPACELDKHYR